MPNRNRTFYNSLGLFVSRGLATGSHTGLQSPWQIPRVQSYSDSFTRNFTDVFQFGNLDAIDRKETTSPTVEGSFSYFVVDGDAENRIGLTVSRSAEPLTSAISGILSKASDCKNTFLAVADEGYDFNNYTIPSTGALTIGSAYLTSYSVQGSVGDFVTADVSLAALNWRVYSNLDGTNNVAAVDNAGQVVTNTPFSLPLGQTSNYPTQPIVIAKDGINLSITGSIGYNIPDLKLQSFTLNVDLNREPLEKLGQRFPFSQELTPPIPVTLSVEADIGSLSDGALDALLCQTGTVDLAVQLSTVACSGVGTPTIAYYIKGAKLNSQSNNFTIGDNGSATLEWEVQAGGIGSPRGLFISGTYQ